MSIDELLTKYSIGELILIIIALLAAIKYIIELIQWFKDKIQKKIREDENFDDRIKKDEDDIQKLIDLHKKTEKDINKINESVSILIDSDKDDIKAWITEQHHKFCYSKGRVIDTYSLQCIKNRYKHYVDEGGNSFIADLMKDIEQLPVYTPDPNEIEIKKND